MGAGHARGRAGEDLAARFLVDHGWEILDRNWRAGHGELDLVARRGGIVTFVEVKTRSQTRAGDPLEWLTPRKRREVEKTSRSWIHERAGALHGVDTVRFDAVAVDLIPGRSPEIRHIPDAWRIGES